MKRWRPLKLDELSVDSRQVYEVLNNESDLSSVLIGTSYLAELLATLLKDQFIESSVAVRILDPQRGIIGGVAARADVAYYLGLIQKSAYQDLIKIAEIRNQFAHKHLALDFGDSSVREACDELVAWRVLLQGEEEEVTDEVTAEQLRTRARNQFKITVVLLGMRLHVDGVSRNMKPRQPPNQAAADG